MTPYYQDAAVTLYHGDCRDVLPALEADALVTDPPYGVEFSGIHTKHAKHQVDGYHDTAESFSLEVLPRVREALLRVKRGAIFCGSRNLHSYPGPRDIGGIVCPNGGGIGAWGFNCLHPVLFYGLPPRTTKEPTVRVMYHPGLHVTGEYNGHPCPKPIAFMLWLVALATLEGETVLDAFVGSGTTLEAAKTLGRKAIGVEIEERYCEIAAKRCAQEVLSFAGNEVRP
jgi:site-specific DNA-methyltransferase (adenine-specific)